ncbi:LytTR family transcriptional regulator DNA-binding domain-containing protein [candidate division KSB1 bacterium]
MNRLFRIIPVLLFLFNSLLFAQSVDQPLLFNLDQTGTQEINKWKYCFGDSREYSDPEFDDSNWETAVLKNFSKEDHGIYWYRTSIRFEGEPDDSDIIALEIFDLPVAYEVYWDGELAASNGNVGPNRENEVSGQVYLLIKLRKGLTLPGDHLLAVRVSDHKRIKGMLNPGISMGYYTKIKESTQLLHNLQLLWMGLFLTAAVICLSLFLGGWRHFSFLLMGIYALFHFSVSLWFYLLYSGDIGTALFQWVDPVISNSKIVPGTILILFTLWYFDIRRKWQHLIFTGIGLLIIKAIKLVFVFNSGTLLYSFFLTGYALGITFFQWKKKSSGSLIIFYAFTCSIVYYIYTLLSGYIPSFFGIMHFMYLAVNIISISLFVLAVIIKTLDLYRNFQVVQLKVEKLEARLEDKGEVPYIVYRKRNENHLLPLENVLYFKASRVFVEVNMSDGRMELIEKPLNRLEDILPDNFFRIHRSYIVNLHYVTSYKHAGGSSYYVQLKNDDYLPVSRYRVKMLNKLLNK